MATPIERSHGKARHNWTRQCDVRPVGSANARTEGRDSAGKFAPGNRAATGQAQKGVIKRGFGSTTGDAKIAAVARDTAAMYTSLLRALPYVDAHVRVQVATQARCAVMGAHCMQQAVVAGVDTEPGRKLLELSAKFEQQALRAGVVAVDLSSKLHAQHQAASPRQRWRRPDASTAATDEAHDAEPEDAPAGQPAGTAGQPSDAKPNPDALSFANGSNPQG